MSRDPVENPTSVAIDQLERFGLSSYAARTFVALASLGTGTARDVSQVSDVPRTQVYAAIDELHGRGLVDVQQSSPKTFLAISPETARRIFEHDFQRRIERLRTALSELEPVQRGSEQHSVWTVDGRKPVTERVIEFVEDAEAEVVYAAVEELFTDDLLAALSDAADRGVEVKLGGSASAIEERIDDAVPGATIFDPLWDWTDSPAGRLVMVDERQTLVSTLQNGPGEPSETAIWAEGEENSLVTVLKAITSWRLTGGDDN